MFEKLPKLALQALLLGGVWMYALLVQASYGTTRQILSCTAAILTNANLTGLVPGPQIAFKGSQKLSDCV
nr:MAG TPA: hypothetical protein [Caudoviricetes sp.]